MVRFQHIFKAATFLGLFLPFSSIFAVIPPMCPTKDLMKALSPELLAKSEGIEVLKGQLGTKHFPKETIDKLLAHYPSSKLYFLGEGLEAAVFRVVPPNKAPFLVRIFEKKEDMETNASFFLNNEYYFSDRIQKGFVNLGFRFPVIKELPTPWFGFEYRDIRAIPLPELMKAYDADIPKLRRLHRNFAHRVYAYAGYMINQYQFEGSLIIHTKLSYHKVSKSMFQKLSFQKFMKLFEDFQGVEVRMFYKIENGPDEDHAIFMSNVLVGLDGELYISDYY